MARILVADDDLVFRELVRLTLEAQGHKIRAVGDGMTALAATRAHKPQLVVLDNMMPVLTGMEVLQEIKGSADLLHVPVIMLSARSQPEDVVGALKAGAADYITKPFIPGELVIKVGRILASMEAQNA